MSKISQKLSVQIDSMDNWLWLRDQRTDFLCVTNILEKNIKKLPVYSSYVRSIFYLSYTIPL